MITEYTNRGVCSRKTVIELAPDGTAREKYNVKVRVNTNGLAKLLKGMNARDAILRLKGIDCNGRGTSCPDQVAKALTEALEKI